MTTPGYGGERIYYRYVGEHSYRQKYLLESRLDMTRLGWVMWGEGGREGRRERGEPGTSAKRLRVRKGKGSQNYWACDSCYGYK